MTHYNFKKFVPYRINWKELEKHTLKVTSESKGTENTTEERFSEIVRRFFDKKVVYKIEEDYIGRWYVISADERIHFQSDTNNNLIDLLRCILELHLNKILFSECTFLYLGEDSVIEDAQSAHEFFIVRGDSIVEESFQITEAPSENTPQDIFTVEEDNHIWRSLIGLEKAKIAFAYDNYYRTTYKGKLLDRADKAELMESLLGTTPNAFGYNLNRYEILTLKDLRHLTRGIKRLSWLLAGILLCLLILVFK